MGVILPNLEEEYFYDDAGQEKQIIAVDKVENKPVVILQQ
jgi:hypothetical protein